MSSRLLFLIVCFFAFPIFLGAATPSPGNSLFGPNHYDSIARRMADISFYSDLPYKFTPEVRSQMTKYYYENSKFVPIALARGEHLFPQIEKQFKRLGVPEYLKYVAVIESLLNRKARSKAGAVGIWQFMEGTADDYNLEVNGSVDERKNVYKSTVAAGRFLKKLHKSYGDWFLALAAYNYGPGNINKILARNPNAKTFWDIQHQLPKETKEYVPKFIAVSYFMEYADEYEFPKVRSRKKVVKKAKNTKHGGKALARMKRLRSGEVSSELEIPVLLRLYPIPVANTLLDLFEDEQPIPYDNEEYILAADLEAIIEGAYDIDSDFPSDPYSKNPTDLFDVEAVLGNHKAIASLGIPRFIS